MKLKKYREGRNIKQNQAAEELDVTKDVYNSWEYGVRIPRPENMKKIAEWSGGQVTANDFYEDNTKS